jgi:cold shock protein
MNPIAKIIIALVIGGAAWGVSVAVPAVPSIALFLAAAVIAALLPSLSAASAAAPAPSSSQKAHRKEAAVADGPREEGSVKWFNVSKGFGFITKDDGEEIFVHFRSIRGEGRRSLRDGQRVSFVEAQSDKGPQAEDVEPL